MQLSYIDQYVYLDKILESKNDNDLIFYHEAENVRNAVISELNMFDRLRKRANLDMVYDNKKTHKITTHSFRAFSLASLKRHTQALVMFCQVMVNT